MIFKQSLKAVLRTPLKTLLFLLLITSVTAFACVGIGMWESGSRLVRVAEDSFTTTANIEYVGGGYPVSESYTESMISELSSFDYSLLSSSSAVEKFDRNFEMGGYIDGFEMPRGIKRYSSSAIFRFVVSAVVDVEYYNDETQQYDYYPEIYAHLLESYYSGDSEPIMDSLMFINIDGRMIYEDNSRYWWMSAEPEQEQLNARIREVFQRGREFIAYGTTYRSSEHSSDSTEAPITFTIEGFDTDLIDLKDTDRYFYSVPLWDITDEDDYQSNHKFEILSNMAESLNVRRHALAVHPTRSVESLPVFYSGETELLDGGRFFTEEEYRKGAKSIIISEYVANRLNVGIGDKVSMSTFLADEESQVAALSFRSRADFVDGGDYEVVGIYKQLEGQNHRVYIPYPVGVPYEIKTGVGYNVATATLKNGMAEQYLSDISSSLLPDMKVTIYDQGYSEVITPIVSMNRTAALLSVLGVCCCIAALVLFTHLYVSRQRDTIAIMESLGAGRARTLSYIVLSLFIIVLLAAAAGVCAGSILSQRIADAAYARSAQKALSDASFSSIISSGAKVDFDVNFKTSLSVVMYIGAGVLLLSIILGLVFTAGVFRRPSVVTTHAGTTFRRRAGFTWKLVFRSIVRSGAKSLLVPVMSLILASFIAFFAADIEKSRAQIDDLNANATINAYLSTINGRRLDLLKIEDYQVQPLLNSRYIKDINYSIRCAEGSAYVKVPVTITGDEVVSYNPYGLALDPGEELRTYYLSPAAEGITFASNISKTREFYFGESPKLEFLTGYDESVFRTDQRVCAVSEDKLEFLGLEPGDELVFRAPFTSVDYTTTELVFSAKIVASYISSSADNFAYLPMGIISSTILKSPSYSAEQIAKNSVASDELLSGGFNPDPSGAFPESLHIPEGFVFKYDFFSFTLKDASKLDEFKAFAKEAGYGSISRDNESYGEMRLSLVIDDARLTASVNNIQRHIDYMTILNIVLYVLSAIISFVLAYLMTKSRRKDLAMMRSMGAGYLKTFNTFFLEQALLFLLGCVVSIGLVYFINGGFSLYQLMYLGGYALCCLAGITVSIVFMNRVDVLKLLSGRE